MIPIYRFVALKMFNFEIIFALSIFEKYVASKVSTRFSLSFYHFAMTWQAPSDQVEYVAFAHPGPSNMRAWDSNDSQ